MVDTWSHLQVVVLNALGFPAFSSFGGFGKPSVRSMGYSQRFDSPEIGEPITLIVVNGGNSHHITLVDTGELALSFQKTV
jgi:hypothetical protein